MKTTSTMKIKEGAPAQTKTCVPDVNVQDIHDLKIIEDSQGGDSQAEDSKGVDSQGVDSQGGDSQAEDSKGVDSQGGDSQGEDSTVQSWQEQYEYDDWHERVSADQQVFDELGIDDFGFNNDALIVSSHNLVRMDELKSCGEDVFHILVRGNDGRAIFFSDYDYKKFLWLLNRCLIKSNSRIYAFVLMTNHAHLLVRSADVHYIVTSLVCGYAGYAHTRYKNNVASAEKSVGDNYSFNKNKYCNTLSGKLFETPVRIYKASNLDYQLDLISYIINNPILAGMCVRPGGYKYSSYLFYTTRSTSLAQIISVDTKFFFDNFKTLDRFNNLRGSKLVYQKRLKKLKLSLRRRFGEIAEHAWQDGDKSEM
ncbi:MAG: hypothetical protein LKM37_00950 [Bacteroidales bacterium]|jgi:REP element-mobilizing transposase RayT|nr:hypothetical protein [Bacteroidales bacterium]MCI1733208.1 hypothetical protein [Bacteroidales bacterium]